MRYAASLVMLAAGMAAWAQDAQHQWDVPLGQCSIEGGKLTQAGIVPVPTYRMQAGEPLRMEAELASDILGPVVPVEDAEASGGRYLHVPNETYRGTGAATVFAVELPVRSLASARGTYRLWARTFWPDIGANSFFLGVDAADARVRQEEQVFGNTEGPQVIGVWHWLAGPEWELAPGAHRITVRWREDGTQLDLAVLAQADYTPADERDMNRPDEAGPPSQMVITTPELKPERVAAWGQVAPRPDTLINTATIYASLDGGGSWREIPNATLAELPVSGDGTDGIRLRLTVRPPLPELIHAISLSYRGGPWKIRLADERVAFDLSLGDGGIIGIRNLVTDTQVASGGAGPLFRLDYLPHDGDAVETIPDENVRFDGYELADDPPAVDLRYTVEAPGGPCRVLCRGELPPDGLPSWRIEVTNEAPGIDLVEVYFPLIAGVQIGPREEDDWLLWPGWGLRQVQRPARSAPGAGLYPSGRAGMSCLDVYEKGDRPQGLYLASEDETVLMGQVLAQPDEGGGSVTIGMSKMPRIRPGASFTSEDFVIAPHEGDWHWAADRYREWLYGWMEPYQPPDWVVEADGWLGSGRGTNFLKDIPARYRLARELGLDYVEFWGQMMCGVAAGESCCNRLYFPDPRYGTEADFAQAIGYVRQAGGHIGFYTNGQAWNPRYPRLRDCYQGIVPEDALIPDWEKEAHNWGLVRADGSYVPQYPKPEGDDSPYPGSFFLMCSHSRGWQDYLHHYIVDKYAGHYGVDAMYVDQVGAATGQVCFANGHGHDDFVGAWGRGHLQDFRRLKTDARQIEPNFALATEGFADVYGQYVDMFLISRGTNSPEGWPRVGPEVLRYTFPEYAIYLGLANGNRGPLTGEQVIDEAFLLGCRFDIFERSAEFMEHCKRVIRLRQETGPLLYRGRFMDDIGLTVDDDRVRGKLWRLDNEDARGWLVNLCNEEQVQGAKVSVQVGDSPELKGLCATPDQALAPLALTRAGASTSFEAPAATHATVLLLTEARPWMVRAFAPVTVAAAEDVVEVRYRPLGGAGAEQGTATLEVPPGWSTRPVTFGTEASQDVKVPFTPQPGSEPGIYPVTVTVRIGDETWTSRETVIIEETLQLQAEVQAGRLLVTLTTRSHAPLEVECAATGPAWVQFPEPAVKVTLPARGSATCVIPWEAPDGVREATEVEVTASVGGRQYRTSAKLEPLDLSLSQWLLAKYEGEVAISRDEAAGILSIRSGSPEVRGGWRWRTAFIEPGARYRFSVQCRTEGIVSEKQGAKARIIFLHRDDPGKAAGDWVLTEPLTGDNDWTEVSAEFEIPPETGRMQIELFNWHAAGLSQWRSMTLEAAD